MPSRQARGVSSSGGERGPGDDGQQVGPRPGNHVDDRVATAPERHPPASGDLVREVVQGDVARPLTVDAEREMGQRVVAMAVAARAG